MTQYRALNTGTIARPLWTVVYSHDGTEWYDLFENPSQTVCQIIVETLTELGVEVKSND